MVEKYKCEGEWYAILSWDWKAQPIEIIDDILSVAHAGFPITGGQELDTGGDGYCVVLSKAPITKERAEQVYRALQEDIQEYDNS